ncbi:MAG: hypothetical protein LAT63_16620 [Marinobacter sp.]|nr:hypothetical protein [Marinobacter sp.]
MTDVTEFRRAKVGALAARETFKVRVLYGLVFLSLMVTLAIAFAAAELKQRVTQVDQGIYRSEAEMINGGRRFIDAFYSLNSATIEYDQFRAIRMMANPELQQNRLQYLAQSDLVRRVRASNTVSRVRWQGAQNKVLSQGSSMRVEYQAQIVLNNRDTYPLHIVLELVPVEKTDDNTDGVGVLSWTDVAKTPFIEGSEQ